MEVNSKPAKMGVKRSFRLRPVDTTGRINRRYGYLRSPCVRSVAWVQLLMGFLTIVAQIMILCTSRRRFEDDLFGSGIGMGMIQILASIFTLMASEEPAYSWLHLAMSFNIISATGFYLFGIYIMWYPMESFIELELHANATPYIDGEVHSLKMYMYIIVVSSVASFAVGSFLAILTARPVCCGQRHLMTPGGRCGRKSSTDSQKSPPAQSGSRSPNKLEFKKHWNWNDASRDSFSPRHSP